MGFLDLLAGVSAHDAPPGTGNRVRRHPPPPHMQYQQQFPATEPEAPPLPWQSNFQPGQPQNTWIDRVEADTMADYDPDPEKWAENSRQRRVRADKERSWTPRYYQWLYRGINPHAPLNERTRKLLKERRARFPNALAHREGVGYMGSESGEVGSAGLLDPVELVAAAATLGGSMAPRLIGAVGKETFKTGAKRVLAAGAQQPTRQTGVLGSLNRAVKNPVVKWSENPFKEVGGWLGRKYGMGPIGESVGKYSGKALEMGVAGGLGATANAYIQPLFKPVESAVKKMAGTTEGEYWKEYDKIAAGHFDDPSSTRKKIAELDSRYKTSEFSKDSQDRIRKRKGYFAAADKADQQNVAAQQAAPPVIPAAYPPENQAEVPPPLPRPIQREARKRGQYGGITA